MERVERDGKVAVLYSPGFGAGWSTWITEYPEVVFESNIVNYVEKEEWDALTTYMTLKYPDAYLGGMEQLRIEWVPKGTAFRIEDYDGAESIEYKDEMEWRIA